MRSCESPAWCLWFTVRGCLDQQSPFCLPRSWSCQTWCACLGGRQCGQGRTWPVPCLEACRDTNLRLFPEFMAEPHVHRLEVVAVQIVPGGVSFHQFAAKIVWLQGTAAPTPRKCPVVQGIGSRSPLQHLETVVKHLAPEVLGKAVSPQHGSTGPAGSGALLCAGRGTRLGTGP